MTPDYLKTIKLGYGKGQRGKQACWMTALQAHISGDWTDKCRCVDYPINQLCIFINDAYGRDGDEARTEDILNFGLFAPLGTKDESSQFSEFTVKRTIKLVDAMIRVWIPYILLTNYTLLTKGKGQSLATTLKNLPEIVNEETINNAIIVMRGTNKDSLKLNPSGWLIDYISLKLKIPEFIDCVIREIESFKTGLEWYNIYNNIIIDKFFSVINSVGWILNLCGNKRQFLLKCLYPTLREMIEMGPHAPTESEPVCGIKKVQELVGMRIG